MQISDSDGSPLQTPPPTSVKDLVLVFVRVPFPQVVEHADQTPQEAHWQSRAKIQKNHIQMFGRLMDKYISLVSS